MPEVEYAASAHRLSLLLARFIIHVLVIMLHVKFSGFNLVFTMYKIFCTLKLILKKQLLTHSLTYLLTPWIRVLLEKLTFSRHN
jgi:hypothetical protein